MIEILSEARIRLRALFRRRTVESELEEELRFHLERQTEANLQTGMPREEALRRARLRFGGVEGVKEECREARGVTLIETLLQDLRFGLRLLAGTPGLTLAAVLTLALGIGANSAILSAANRVLWRPLPFPSPERLVFLQGGSRQGGASPLSAPNFLDLQEQNRSFEYLATFGAAGLVVERKNPADGAGLAGGSGEGSGSEWLRAGRVSPDFFAVLGSRAAVGRTFVAGDGRAGGERVTVLGHTLWLRRFGGDRAIVGKPVVLNAAPYTVIGVLPESFEFSIPGAFKPAELWVPQVLERDESQRNNYELRAIARLRPGVSQLAAQADLDTVSRRLAAAHPSLLTGLEMRLVPLRQKMTGEVRPFLLILLGAVTLLLLIACANVAGLQLVRASARQKEIALRLALGAGRARLVRQLLTESLLLALAGGTLGLLLASGFNAGTHLLGGLLPTGLPGGSGHGLDPGAVSGALLLSLGSGLLFGLAPALQAARTRGGGKGASSGAAGLGEVLKEGSRSSSEGRSGGRLRGVLMAGEVALALVLLAGAGLLLRSFFRVLAERPGFDLERVLTQSVRLPHYAYPEGAAQAAFYRRTLERLASLPGVEAAGGIDDLPLTSDRDASSFALEAGEPWTPDRSPVAQTRTVSPDYFRAMGIPVLRGRPFSPADSASAPPVALINHTLARRYFGRRDPVGSRLTFGSASGGPAWLTIVGEVADTRDLGLAIPPEPEVYLPYEQSPLSAMNVVLRTSGDPGRLAHAANAAIQELDRGLPLAPAQPMRAIAALSLAQRRFSMVLMGLFALVALALAAAGIYGVLSYSASRRTHEIGVRMALGAQRSEVFRLVIGRSLAVTALGVGIGLLGALGSTRLLGGLLYGVPATDPATLSGVALLLFAVAAVAGYLPARRATEVSPVTALKGG